VRGLVLSDSQETLVGFRLAGLSGRLVDRENVDAVLDEALQEEDLALIAFTEEAASWVSPRLRELRLDGGLPLVVEVPGPGGVRRGQGFMERFLQDALGVKS
jgi:vacuolar-type H+-ATPase subunit F/Vma7